MANEPAPAPIEQAIIDTHEEIEDIDEVSTQLAEYSAISETRHREIVEQITSCNQRLEHLSTRLAELPAQTTQAENPVLSQIAAQLTQVQSQMAELKADLNLLKDLKPRIPPIQSASPEPEPVEPATAQSIVEPAQVASATPIPKRRRFRVL